MLTLKLKIKNDIDVSERCNNYSYAFRKLYTNFELSEDKTFIKQLYDKYNFDSWFFESCKTEVKMKLEQKMTFDKKNLERLKELELELKENMFVSKKGKRRKYYLIKNISSLKASIGRKITFGTRELLQRITFLSNPISKKITDSYNTEKLKLELVKLEENRIKELAITKEQYQKNRILPIYVIGEAPQGSNRKFDFDLTNNKVVFKPSMGVKIPIEFHCSKSQQDNILSKLQGMIGVIPISIRLNNEYIWLSYDEEKLSGMAFDKNEYFKELKTIDKTNKDARKDCYKKYIIEQENRMFFGKNINMYLGIDLNPEYIGFCITKKISDTDYKIIYKEVISLKNLNTKLNLSSTDKNQVYQNNKRIHEIREVWKYIFNLAKRYKVAHIVMEDLDFKLKSINTNSNEANIKTKNIWHRTLTTNLITKYCNTIGLKLITVNPCYSSFIGNIQHNYYDPLNSAIEICRRGITKYFKGGFYPVIERKDLDTMSQLGLDVLNNTVSSWIKAFQLFKTAKLRYRRELINGFVENNLLSFKSNVKTYAFNTI